MAPKIDFLHNDETERRVFDWFVPVCPLGIVAFESRPTPEPDILATLGNGDKIAFELVEVEDPKVLRIRSTNLPLNLALADASKQIAEPAKWRSYFISVYYTDRVKWAARANYIPQIIQTLNDNQPGEPYYGIRDDKNTLLVSLRAHKTDFDNDVSISVPNSTGVADYTIANISKKLTRKYVTPHPVHLLAWTRRTWEGQEWREILPELFSSQSLFDRIWIFAYGTKSIAFDSGPKLLAD